MNIDNRDINQIIEDHTSYHNGKYRYNPTISGLNSLLEDILQSHSTPKEYIRITPFYRNEKLMRQIEFEGYMFFVECRDSIDENLQRKHILECMDVPDVPRVLKDIKVGAILYPLFLREDVSSFQGALIKYQNALNDLLPQMMKVTNEVLELTEEDYAFGFFCFEVHSR